jgi:uncharacterized protein (TIGR00375 family)
MAAAAHLTLPAILEECRVRKGIGMIGVIDAAALRAQSDLQALRAAGEVEELPGGGLAYQGEVTLVPGCEAELVVAGKAVHFLVYLPGMRELAEFARWQEGRVRNRTLSSQRHHETEASDLVREAAALGGVVIPAHAFTPFKGLFAAAAFLSEVVPPALWSSVPAVELGLSADTAMADQLPELAPFAFLSNSDAHSLPKIAREYNVLRLEEPTFAEWVRAMRGDGGRRIEANYGLDPRLGKYHRSWCLACDRRLEGEPPVLACDRDPSHRLVIGVLDRLRRNAEIQAGRGAAAPATERHPPYIHQVPLEYVPGLGPRARQRLFAAFGTEMGILHRASRAELAEVVGDRLAGLIDDARTGQLSIEPGAGGHYGRLVME